MSLPNDRNANTVTISSSSTSNGLSTSQSYQTSPSEFGAPVAPLFSSRGAQQAGASGTSQQPLGSTAFRNRFLNSSSASSLSSANNSPDMGGNLSSSTSATSNPTPPNASSTLGQGGNVGAGGFKLAPLGAAGSGLSRKPSISMLSAVAEDRSMAPPASRHAPIDTRHHAPARVDRAAKPAVDLGRASLDERRAYSPPRESDGMVPYAHRRTASRTVGPGDSSVLSESTTTGSGTHGGTTLVNTAHGGGLKRSNSETVTQGLMGPPAASATTITRPPSSMSLYRDEQPQQAAPLRPTVARVPSGRQALAERPMAAEVHAEPQDGYRHMQPDPQPQQQQQPAFQPYQDENAYSSRAPYGRPDGPLPPPPAPSTSLPPHQQQGARPVLAEVNRAYPQPQAPSTQQRSTAPLYGVQTAQKAGGEYQVPLRDRSPGLADATPSVTVQQAHYQSQQAYQQRHQQQQYQQPHAQHLPPQQGVSFAPEQQATEKKIAKPIIARAVRGFIHEVSTDVSFAPQVNGRPYTRCGLLGRGGSSKVYRVISERNDILALKKVDTRNDSESRSSFINEITLLRKLAGKPEIIQLVDSEIQGRHVIMVSGHALLPLVPIRC